MTFEKSLIISWLVLSFSFIIFGLQVEKDSYAFPVIPPILLSGALFLSKINSSVKIDTKIKFLSEKVLPTPFLVALLIVSVIFSTSPNYIDLARNQMWWMKSNYRDASHYVLANYQEGDLIYARPFMSVTFYLADLRVEPLMEPLDVITNLQMKSGRVWFIINIEQEEYLGGQLDNRFLTFLKEECSLKYIARNTIVKVYLFQKS